MTRPVHRAALCSALLLGALLLGPASAPAAADDHGEERWQRLLQRMIDAVDERAHSGRLVVVSFADDGPVLGELAVARTEDGTVMSNQTRSWMIGQQADEIVLADVEEGRQLRLATAQRGVFSLARLSRNYDVTVEGRERTPVGIEAVAVSFTPREGEQVRERLHLDPHTGLVLRRETFAADGQPVRLVAYTTLELGSDEMPELGSGWVREEVEPMRSDISPRGVEILRDVGWVVPRALRGGFRLVDAGALGAEEGDESSLHLLYTDGLYALSVYEQEGRLDEGAVREAGAEPATLGALTTYRWPGPEPAVLTWTAQDMTFTAVSDAPPDVLATALATFPHEAPSSLTDRLRRGLSRALDVVRPSE